MLLEVGVGVGSREFVMWAPAHNQETQFSFFLRLHLPRAKAKKL